jgi:hypothetical protein
MLLHHLNRYFDYLSSFIIQFPAFLEEVARVGSLLAAKHCDVLTAINGESSHAGKV